ncbi:MAG: GNAT family N-acyltransferase [bacterium]
MKSTRQKNNIFSLHSVTSSPAKLMLLRLVETLLGGVLSLRAINRVYNDIVASGEELDIFTRILERLNVEWDFRKGNLESIPTEGPLIVTSHHPFGLLDALLLGNLLNQVRQDFKIMGNVILHNIPEVRPYVIPVNPFESRNAIVQNIKPLRNCVKWLQEGNVLGIFPAGEVSSLKLKSRLVQDREWNQTIGWIARKTKAPVLPVTFHGRNSAVFQMAGIINARLRTALLPREMLKKQNTCISISIGSLVTRKQIAQFENDKTLTRFLQFKTDLLRLRELPEKGSRRWLLGQKESLQEPMPVAPPVSPEKIRMEVQALPEDQHLISSKGFLVFHASAQQIPILLEEIGRQREISFREIGEGTGKAADLDHFDEYYQHLVCWNQDKGEIAGAYRFGLMDRIMRDHGLQGLYINTLFDIKPQLMAAINPAIEMGRSFIRREYQKNFMPLMLLWKGISHYILRNPDYKIMIGPVSISKDFRSLSKRVIIEYLLQYHREDTLYQLVKPKNPPRLKTKGVAGRKKDPLVLPRDVADISEIISEIEPAPSGMPILIKNYLRLGGKVLSFNLDPEFSNVIDGLIMVDVTKTDPRTQKHYMGKEGMERFMAYHNRPKSRLA